MVRRVAPWSFVFITAVLSGCSTASDYAAAQNGEFRSQNLWPTNRETRAGQE
jgi:hypothetical protein